MIEYYLPIKLVHVAAVLASGGLFLLRGLGVQLGAAWPQVAPVRMLSYVIDTTLLIAALMLSSMLRQYRRGATSWSARSWSSTNWRRCGTASARASAAR